jgi:hypothetical protein
VDIGETAVRYRYLRRLEVDVLVYFAPLAKHAQSSHESDGFGHLGPAETAVMSRRVARTPGRWMECSELEKCLSHLDGNQQAENPVETSPIKDTPPLVLEIICRVSEVSIFTTSGQDCCRAAIAKESTGCALTTAAKLGCKALELSVAAWQGPPHFCWPL